MTKKKQEVGPITPVETKTRKPRKLDVDKLRSLADSCSSKAAGEILLERLNAFVEAKAAYKLASTRARQAAVLASE